MKHVLQLLKIPETRERIMLTLWWLFVYRLGFHIHMPGVSHEFIKQQAQTGSTVFGLLSAFSGGSIGDTVIFGLGIMPYISASIIFSVLAKVSPQIEAIQKEGASGQKKINQWTRLVTVPIALLQSTFIWFGVYSNLPGLLDGEPTFGLALTVILALTAGSLFVMWLGELITEYGLGNGSSLIIMAGIISNMPGSLQQIMASQDEPYNSILTLIAIWVTIVFVVVFVQKGERRVPIQYARLTRGRRVYGGQRHYLPLKINMAGVMPIIFASAIFIIPGVVFRVVGLERVAAVFGDTDGFVHVTLYVILVFFFCFFWNNLMFRPEEIADNLREHGSFIPGIRPGAKTAAYLKDILTRITLAGAVFLAFLAVLPNFITGNIPGLSNRLAYFLGGTSVLIVVGVAMDLVDRLNAQLTMRNYEGFVKGKGGTGGGAGGLTGGQGGPASEEMALVVILLGAPGAGKGTQAARLAQARALPHVSTGDLLRDNKARGTPLGKTAQGYMDKGELVPDALVLDMLSARVAAPDCREGYVLDGFPRTEVQAQALEQRLQPGDQVRVVNLEVADETIVARAAGRLSCSKCGRVYHAKSAPPAKPGVCDACGGALVQRSDDAAPVVRERLRVYHEKTAPLVRFYAQRGLLTTIDGEQSPDAVFSRLNALIPGKERR